MGDRILYGACPLCGGPHSTIGHIDWTMHERYQPGLEKEIVWCRCTTCDHVFTEGYWTPEAQAILFQSTDKTQTPESVSLETMHHKRMVWAPVVSRVQEHTGNEWPGKWLDVGTGAGHLLFAGREAGFTMEGTDLRFDTCTSLQMVGYPMLCTPLSGVAGRYDAVSMCDVLEHTPFPKQELKEASRLLRPGGVLYLSMPNSETEHWKAMDAANANPYWVEGEHFHNFSRARLMALLRETGFAPQSYWPSNRYISCMEVLAIKLFTEEK